MEIAIADVETANIDCPWYNDYYTIYVGDHRILTVSTDSSSISRKWLQDVYNKSRCSNTKHGNLIVGLCAERYSERVQTFMSCHGLKESDCPYDLVKLCIGAHCLFYELPDTREYTGKKHGCNNRDEEKVYKALNDLLTCANVVTVGIKMTSLAKDLQRLNGISISNPVDLNVMAAEVMPVKEMIDLGRCYDLDRLAKAVLGKNMYATRPKQADNRCCMGYGTMLSDEKVKKGTLDTYLAFLIAYKLLDLTDGSVPAVASSFIEATEKKKPKKKKKSKSNHN